MSRELVINALYANRVYRDVLVLEFTLQLQDVMSGGKGNLAQLIAKLNETRPGDVTTPSHRRLSTERLKATGRLDILIAVNHMMMAQHGASFDREGTLDSLRISLALRISLLSKRHPTHNLRCRDPEKLITTIVFPEAKKEERVIVEA